MTTLERLAAFIQQAYDGEADRPDVGWHGPSVSGLLRDLTAEEALRRVLPGTHTIWELVLHLGGTYRLVLRRLAGGDPQLTPAEDWPAVPEPTAANWPDAVHSLRSLNQQIRHAVRGFDERRLDQPITPEPAYTAWTQFIGITQHDLYHAGQIALLKKALDRK